MITKCAWCHPKGQRFAAQNVLRHSVSHGMCDWHQKFELAKLDALDRKLGSVSQFGKADGHDKSRKRQPDSQ